MADKLSQKTTELLHPQVNSRVEMCSRARKVTRCSLCLEKLQNAKYSRKDG